MRFYFSLMRGNLNLEISGLGKGSTKFTGDGTHGFLPVRLECAFGPFSSENPDHGTGAACDKNGSNAIINKDEQRIKDRSKKWETGNLSDVLKRWRGSRNDNCPGRAPRVHHEMHVLVHAVSPDTTPECSERVHCCRKLGQHSMCFGLDMSISTMTDMTSAWPRSPSYPS
jgi:hypothetical protein